MITGQPTPQDRILGSRFRPSRVRSQTVSPYQLAVALDIPVAKILLLAEQGYLCMVSARSNDPDKRGPTKRVVRLPLPTDLKLRIVDRASIVLWLMGLDDGQIPVFNKFIEIEIMRIAKLPLAQRTEQAIRMLRRYRDAEAIVVALAEARAGDVTMVEIKKRSGLYKQRLLRLAGI